MDTIRVAVIGAGRMGAMHAQNLSWHVPGAALVCVADADEGAARRCAESLGARFTRDVAGAVTDADISAVVIATPTPTHVDLVTAAAKAKKHIFCEKPVAMELGRLDAVLKAVSDAGVTLQVGFHRRFDPSFARAQQAIASGTLGAPVMLSMQSCDAAVPPLSYLQTSGGVFRDMLIHDFDMARFLVGSEVREVMAYGSCLIEPKIKQMGDADTVVAVLRFDGGALGVLRGCRQNATGHDVRAEVLMTKGTIEVGNPRQTAVTVSDATGTTTDRFSDGFLTRFPEAYVAEMRAFVDALTNRKPTPVPGEAARAALALALAATRSAAERRPVAPE